MINSEIMTDPIWIPPCPTPTTWYWEAWGVSHNDHEKQWYIGYGFFDRNTVQYWELDKPSRYVEIGLVYFWEKDGKSDQLWTVNGDGICTGGYRFNWYCIRGSVGLYFNPDNRTISLFTNQRFRTVLWWDIPGENIYPLIVSRGLDGFGIRTQGMSRLGDECNKHLLWQTKDLAELPLPERCIDRLVDYATPMSIRYPMILK